MRSSIRVNTIEQHIERNSQQAQTALRAAMQSSVGHRSIRPRRTQGAAAQGPRAWGSQGLPEGSSEAPQRPPEAPEAPRGPGHRFWTFLEKPVFSEFFGLPPPEASGPLWARTEGFWGRTEGIWRRTEGFWGRTEGVREELKVLEKN